MKAWIINVTWAGWDDDVHSYTYVVKSETKPDEKYIIDFHNAFIADEDELPDGVINTAPFEYDKIGRAHYVERYGDKEIALDKDYEGFYPLNYSVNEVKFYEKLGEVTIGDHYHENGEWTDQDDLSTDAGGLE